jgi:DNA-binding XRE family transcriptional regulator
MRKNNVAVRLAQRSAAENVWLDRRRRGLTQSAYAAAVGIGRTLLSDIERDSYPPVFNYKPVVPTLGDLCALARRRSEVKLSRLERLLGVSKVTILAYERRGDKALAAFWRGRGFRFPKENAGK